jgi:hypothetical protein
LKRIVIPRSVRFIDGFAFVGLNGITICVQKGNKSFVAEKEMILSFDRTRLIRYFGPDESVVIPQIVGVLDAHCFSHCTSVSAISFESDSRLARVESYAFCYSELESIVIPRGVHYVAGSAFLGCSGLSILMQSENESIAFEDEFFVSFDRRTLIRYVGNEESVIIPRSVEAIAADCFCCCGSLSSIFFESDPLLKRIESKAFHLSALESITIPRTTEFISGSAFSAVENVSIAIEDGNQSFAIENECVMSFDRQTLVRYLGNEGIVLVPRHVGIIGPSSFSHCRRLFSLSFGPDSQLTRIESKAFCYASLDSIIIPQNVSFIDGSAFSAVGAISISIEGENRSFVIQDDFLMNAGRSILIRFLGGDKPVVVPCSLRVLGRSSFSHCPVSSLLFESHCQLKRIESRAFKRTQLLHVDIPRGVVFIACDSFPCSCDLSIGSGDSNENFAEWERKRQLGCMTDFHSTFE